MKRQKFGPHEVLIGLDWDIPSGDTRGSESSMIRSMLRSDTHKGCRFGTVVRSNDASGGITVGFVPASETTRPKLPAAAAMLAMASHLRRMSGPLDSGLSTTENVNWNWLVIEKLDDENYWLVSIMNGAPVPTSDIIGSFDTVIETATEFLQRSGNDFVIHTRDDEVRSALSLIADSSSTQGFFELLGDADGLRIADAVPKQIAGLRMSMFIIAVAMLVVIFGTVLFLHWRHQHEAELARQRMDAAAALSAQRDAKDFADYQIQVAQAVQVALVAGKKTIDQALTTPPPSAIISQWTDMARQIDQDQAGWEITGLTCQASGTPTCHVALSRGDMGINRIFMALHPDAVIEGDTASFDLTGQALQDRAPNWNHLGDAKSFMLNLISDLQLLRNGGLEYHQDSSAEIVQPVVMPVTAIQKFKPGSADKVGPPPTVQMGVASGKLGVGGKAIWQLDGIGEFLNHAGITLQGITFSIGKTGVSDWKLDGTYYLRSRPQPTLPVIMLDGKPLPLELPKEFQEVRQASGGVTASNGQAADLGAAPAPAGSAGAIAPNLLPPPPPPLPALPKSQLPAPSPQNF